MISKFLRKRFERAISPGLGYCYCCERPWKTNDSRYRGNTNYQLNRMRFWGLIGVEPHRTRHELNSACFPLCESCWASLTPEKRLPYYNALVNEWIRQLPSMKDEYDRQS